MHGKLSDGNLGDGATSSNLRGFTSARRRVEDYTGLHDGHPTAAHYKCRALCAGSGSVPMREGFA
ncbi:hypothetical protein GCM10023317_96750 [Actinopolymorpha pittospori]|uniref:Uncharacterized protein n=1 Tax=Actinopolymorpha pittospori TaxID=648752 RepID=A0A927MRN2_9ACTN|nr:hypothetical protein [Actinopolymorpha pittospori]